MNALDGSTWIAYNAGLGVMMLGAAGLLLGGSMHRWLGWVALVLGVALFIPFADFLALLLHSSGSPWRSVALARAKSEAPRT